MIPTALRSSLPVHLGRVRRPTCALKLLNDADPGVHWHATDPNLSLGANPVTKRDQTAALHSLECHKSQFSPENMKKLGAVVEGRPVVWSR